MHIYIYIISRGYRWMGYMGWWGYHPKYLGNTKHTNSGLWGWGVVGRPIIQSLSYIQHIKHYHQTSRNPLEKKPCWVMLTFFDYAYNHISKK